MTSLHHHKFQATARRLSIESLESRRMLAITVNTLDDVTANDGFTSLREAIAITNTINEDTIDFAVAGTITLEEGELAVTDSLTINGEGQIIVDANNQSRVLNFSSATGDLTLNEMTLRNGRVRGLDDAGLGAGIFFDSEGTLTLNNSTVSDNLIDGVNSFVGMGAGISSVDGDVVLVNSTVSNNRIFVESLIAEGGGIFNRSGDVTLRNSTISGNVLNGSRDGSAVRTYSGNISLTNSTVSENSIGALSTFAGDISLTSSTVSGNQGLGIYVENRSSSPPSVTIQSSIVANNVNEFEGNQDILFFDEDAVLTINHSLIGVADELTRNGAPLPITGNVGNLTGTAASPLDPKLEFLTNNGGPTATMALFDDSPAIDAGTETGLEFDQRGDPFAREFGDRVDMGAYELQAPPQQTADFDQDGDVDGGDFLIWQRNAGTLTGANISEGDADLDGDVDADDLNEWQARYHSIPNIEFTESSTSVGSGLLNHDIDLADLNGDAHLDAFVTSEGGPNQVWLGNGDGTFSLTNQAFGVGNNIYAALGDIDNDGDIDAAIAVASSEVALWLNDGNGFFSSGGSLAASSPLDLALADLDGDNRLDLFVVQVAGPDLVYLNDATNGFVDSGQQLGNGSSKSVELADLNGDGFLDAFVAQLSGSQGAPNQVWFNDGNGNFTSSGQQIGNSVSQHVALGDIDGDGDIDAVVANGGANRVFRNNGSGVFSDSGQMLGDSESSHVQLADFDQDGDLDAFVANWFDQPDRVWLNNGTGQFFAFQQLGADTSSHVALGDIDNDGDIDAVTATYSVSQSNRIWLNNESDPLATLDQAFSEFSDDAFEELF